MTQDEVYTTSSKLLLAKRTSADILNIPNLSVQNASNLVEAIDSTIVPQVQTEDLMRDANDSATLAQHVLEAAQNERYRALI